VEQNDNRLALAVRRHGRRADVPKVEPAEAGPSSYEQVTRRGLDDLTREVERIETKVNGILFAIVGSILIDLYRTIVR
jgi:hypothetical protein